MSAGPVAGTPPPVEASRPPPAGPNDPPASLPPSKDAPPEGEAPGDKVSGQKEAPPSEALTSIIGEEKDEKPLAEGAPKDGYADFKLPEGVELDKEMLTEAQTFMSKDLNLSQEKAQKLVDFHIKALQGMAEAPYQLWADTQRTWQNEITKDPELGGSNLSQVKTSISKLLDEYGDPKVREALSFTGAGNNPAIIRTLYKIAKVLTEGSFVPGGATQGDERTAAQVMYPTMK
jgi:hypothetical protein